MLRPERCLVLVLHLCEYSMLMMLMLVSMLNDGDIDMGWDAVRVRGYVMLSNLDLSCMYFWGFAQVLTDVAVND